MNEQRLHTLFSKYLENSLSTEEEEEFFERVNEAENLQLLEGPLETWWQETKHFQNTPSLESRRRIKRVLERIDPKPEKNTNHRNRVMWYAGAVASILVVLGLVISQYSNRMNPAEVWYTLSTDYGKQKRVVLPDSTIVHLHAGTTLRYTGAYNDKKREVELEGEAFFEVTKNPKKPFIVRSGHLYTKVLGTSFNVNAFDDEDTFHITVVSGKVEVGTVGDGTSAASVYATLLPNDQLLYDRERQTVKVDKVEDMQLLTSWMKNTLVFHELRLGEVATLLERWYAVQITFGNDALKEQRFTGSFESLSLQQVMELLSMTGNFTYTLDGQALRIDDAR